MFKFLSETITNVSRGDATGRDWLTLGACAVATYAGCKLAEWQVRTDATGSVFNHRLPSYCLVAEQESTGTNEKVSPGEFL